MKSTGTLSLDVETLVELTPEETRVVNGGYATVSSAMPQPNPGGAVSSVLPPRPAPKHHAHHRARKHQHHHFVSMSSVRPV